MGRPRTMRGRLRFWMARDPFANVPRECNVLATTLLSALNHCHTAIACYPPVPYIAFAMRITGGILRGRVLAVPHSRVRPTQDRVRSALFSMLGERISGSRFLDLFAGTGAVGLEAMSRGAAAVTWVEADPRVIKILRRNVLALCGLDRTHGMSAVADEPVEILSMDATAFLKRRRDNGLAPYDVVFADPPYGWTMGSEGLAEWLLRAMEASGALAEAGWVVTETDAAVASPPTGWRLLKERAYGSTRLHFFERNCGSAGECSPILLNGTKGEPE